MRNLHEKMYLDEFIFAMKHDLTYKILFKNLFIKVKQETQRKKKREERSMHSNCYFICFCFRKQVFEY